MIYALAAIGLVGFAAGFVWGIAYAVRQHQLEEEERAHAANLRMIEAFVRERQ